MDRHRGMKQSQIDEVVRQLRKGSTSEQDRQEKVHAQLEALVHHNTAERTVLGYDVYRYSKYDSLAQALIPHVLRLLLRDTVQHVMEHETAFFGEDMGLDLDGDHIDTGDGGFLVFPDPVSALVFLLYYQANLLVYNSANSWPEIAEITRGLAIRYSLTRQPLYRYESNWFGPAIVNNARILAADRLNRLLIDGSVKEWFDLNTNGVETLSVLGLDDLRLSNGLRERLSVSPEARSLVFPAKATMTNMIRSVNLSQIGEVMVKDDTVSVYNLHLQCFLNYTQAPEITKNVVTLGNLNTAGIGRI